MESRRQRGFTLIELMIVVAIIAVIASIAIPNLLSARLNANESAAVATMRNLASSQAQVQASGAIDVNGNGAGEFGYLVEMAGAAGIRTATGAQSPTLRVSPTILSGAFSRTTAVTYAGGTITTGGAVLRSGYLFSVFLPSAASDFVPEATTGGASATNNPDPGQSEVLWCCYAWPAARGSSGKRCFFVSQSGEVLFGANVAAGTLYSGTTNGPSPNAAFLGTTMATTVASNSTGSDGQRWTVIN